MRPAIKTAIGLLVVLLPACELKLKQAKTPPPPQPTVAQAQPAPAAQASAEPLSTPQTQVRLPPPQPIDPEAVVTPPPPPEPSLPRPRKSRAGAQAAAAPPAKPEPTETAEAPAPEVPPRRMEPVLPEEQRRQKMEEISARLKEVEQALARVTPRTDAQKHTVEQIRNFATQAYQAKDEGDIQKASGLAERALLLVQDLARAR